MKRKPREPEQHYWLDLPTREPLSFCQANFTSAPLPHTPDPTSPSLLLSDFFLFLRQGCSNLVLRLGTHWAVAMVTGKLLVPCASKGTFPLLEFLPSLCTQHNETPSLLQQWHCAGGREKQGSLQYWLTACILAGLGSWNWVFLKVPSNPDHSGILWSTGMWWLYTCICPVLSNIQSPVLPPPQWFFKANYVCQDCEILFSHTTVFLFQYRTGRKC